MFTNLMKLLEARCKKDLHLKEEIKSPRVQSWNEGLTVILGANLSGDLTVQVFLLELKLYFLWPSYKVPQVLSGQPETYFLQSTLLY